MNPIERYERYEEQRGSEEPWWGEELGEAGPYAWLHCQAIENRQYAHHQRLLFNALQYSNREISAFDWGWGRTVYTSLLPAREAIDDLIGSVVNSHIAAVGKTKVKARPKTKRATFKLRRASRKLDRYLYAEAKRLDLWAAFKQAFADSCWGEVGALYWYYDESGPCVERVFPDELIIDNAECFADPRPMTVFRRRAVHVESAIKAWGLESDLADALRAEATQGSSEWVQDRSPGPGWVVVVEAFRVACGGDRGRHTVGTKNLTVLDEYWDYNLPFTFFHYQVPVSGFYCRSAVERAFPWQRRLDELNAVIRDAQDLMARPRLWAPLGSKIDVRDLTNRVGRIIHSAIEPKPLAWPTNVQELYEERRRCKEECFADFGMTPMSVQGKLPNGTRLDSSKALNEYSQIADDLQVDLAQRYEKFQMAGFEKLIEVAEQASKAGVTWKTTWVAGRRVEEIDWRDIDYAKDRYTLQLEPSSTMNETMAAHLDEAAKLVQAGIITPEEYLSLQATPDTEKLISLKLAAIENIYKTIEQIEDGTYVAPSPLQDLVNGVKLVHYHMLDLQTEYDDVPERVLRNLKLWILQAQWILDQGTNNVESEPVVPPAPGDQTAMMPPVDSTGAVLPPGMAPGMVPPGAAGEIPTTPSLAPNATQLR